MSGFSTASLDAICVPVSSRALSAAGTLDDVAARLPSDPHESTTALEGLSELSKVLKRFGESVECLREALSKATVISGMLQTALVASLQTSEQGIAVIERNVAAVQISKGRVPLPEATVQIYRRLVDQLAQVVALLIGLLGRANALDQEAVLTEPETQRLLRDTEIANVQVLDNPSFRPTSPSHEAPVPPYSATEDERAAEGSASRKGKEKEDSGGFGSLFRSIISVFTPQVEPLVSALCQACMVGSIPQVKGLLSQGANVNSINEDGRTPLMCAVRADQVEVARLLIQEGAAIGHSGRKFGSQRPALYHAAECGSLASMRLLLEKGADPNVRSGWPGQPFFADIVTSGSLEAARLLLDHGVDPNTREMTGMPVLSRAIQEGREPFVKLLLERGADANCRNAMGLPMVVDCIKSGKLAMARLLLMYRADPNSRDLSGTPVLLHAIMSRNEEAAMMLLDYGADANASCWSGHNALVLAVQARMAPLVKKLLERGANPNQKVDDAYGGMCGHRCSGQASNQQSLLLWTLYNTLYDSDRLELARLLLVHGADVRRKSAIGSCALVYAVAHGKRELARLLLEHGADPNASPGSGQSLLLFAVEQSDEPMAQLLLKHGADANFSTASSGGSSSGRGSGLTGDPNGLTPLMVAVDRGDIEVVRTLVKHGADINRESAVTTEPASSVSQTVVAARHPPEIAVGSSSTPLQRARQLGFHDIVTVLQRGGAVGSARSQGGRGGRWASTGGNSRTSTSRSSGTRVAVSGCAASGADSPAEQQRLLSPTTVSRASLVDTNMGEVPPPDYDSTVAVSPGAQASTRN